IHHIQREELVEFHQSIAEEVASISYYRDRLVALESEINIALEQYKEAANLLSEGREKFGDRLIQVISDRIANL
ncbi:DNA repair protein RecN, partial [Pseudoalteromonas sp. S1649]